VSKLPSLHNISTLSLSLLIILMFYLLFKRITCSKVLKVPLNVRSWWIV